MKKAFMSLAIILLLCGCSIHNAAQIEINSKQYETDISTVDAENIRFSGIKDTEFQTDLNKQLDDELASSLVAFESAAQDASPNLTMGNKAVFNNKWHEKYNKNNFISMINEEYTYLGGAHGSTAWRALNVDTVKNKTLTLSDLFADSGYKETLNRMISELVLEKPDEYKDLWAKPELKDSHQNDFYIEDGNLVIYFQPYDLSYYARGFVEFPLKLEELSGYLNAEYRRLIPGNVHQPKVTRKPNVTPDTSPSAV